MYGQTWDDLAVTPAPLAWQMVRSLHHEPPGRAERGDRKGTFGAALEQAEQFFAAAAVVGPATRPVMIFYGLSQAGRAVAAAAMSAGKDDWRLTGHGITTGPLQDLQGAVPLCAGSRRHRRGRQPGPDLPGRSPSTGRGGRAGVPSILTPRTLPWVLSPAANGQPAGGAADAS